MSNRLDASFHFHSRILGMPHGVYRFFLIRPDTSILPSVGARHSTFFFFTPRSVRFSIFFALLCKHRRTRITRQRARATDVKIYRYFSIILYAGIFCTERYTGYASLKARILLFRLRLLRSCQRGALLRALLSRAIVILITQPIDESEESKETRNFLR